MALWLAFAGVLGAGIAGGAVVMLDALGVVALIALLALMMSPNKSK